MIKETAVCGNVVMTYKIDQNKCIACGTCMSEKGKRKEKNQEKSLKNRKNPVILSGNIEKWYILKMENTCKKKLFGV